MTKAAIEKRIAVLERELAKLKEKVEGATDGRPWWERIAGSFEQDSAYRKAMNLGREYRRAQRPEAK